MHSFGNSDHITGCGSEVCAALSLGELVKLTDCNHHLRQQSHQETRLNFMIKHGGSFPLMSPFQTLLALSAQMFQELFVHWQSVYNYTDISKKLYEYNT